MTKYRCQIYFFWPCLSFLRLRFSFLRLCLSVIKHITVCVEITCSQVLIILKIFFFQKIAFTGIYRAPKLAKFLSCDSLILYTFIFNVLQVRRSQKFGKILELILLMGNIMNTGSRNEQSLGFDISYLPKLSNTKDRDNKSTLLHFLVETIEKSHPKLLNFYVSLKDTGN